MADYKMEAAKASLNLISPGQTIGLGAGTSILHLADLIGLNKELRSSVTFVSSSFRTRTYLVEKGLNVHSSDLIKQVDIYFDGCDQFDEKLNALKSGGGIHTTEKILASFANEFILIGDDSKLVPELTTAFPVVIEFLKEAQFLVFQKIKEIKEVASIELRMSTQKDGAVISENGNLIADIRFSVLPELAVLNLRIKQIPGVIEHSLFYRLATKAVIAGEEGIRIIEHSR